MARPLRLDIENGWYHVTSRGLNGMPIYDDDRDRDHFLELLEEVTERYRLLIHAYVLMSNHYHLIAQTPEANLSRAMQWLNVSYGAWYNNRHSRVGPVFQGRFKSKWIEDSLWAYEASVYVHLNPVRIKQFGLDKATSKLARAGLLERPPSKEEVTRRLKVLRTYPWTSYRYYGGYAKAPEWLTTEELSERAAAEASERTGNCRKETERRIRYGEAESKAEQIRNGFALGSEGFARQIRNLAGKAGREQVGKRAVRGRCRFEDVVRAVEQMKGEKWDEFKSTRGDWGRPLVLWAARRYTGQTLSQIGQLAGGMDYGAVAMMLKRFETRSARNRKLRESKDKLSSLLHVKT